MIGKAVFSGGNAQSLDNVAGQPIAEYTHTKSGTVHKLEGPVNAKNIVFKATGDYNDGDTWILNNTPVAVTYNGGEELLPTAVLIGDVLQAVVMRNQLRLMLQKPTPQENLLRNGDWESGIINQQAKDEYTDGGYTIDGWHVNKRQGMKLKVLKGKISIENLVEIPSTAVWAPSQDIESAERFQGEILTVAAVIDRADDNWYLFIRAGGDDNIYILGLSQKVKTGLNTISFTVPAGTKFIKCGLFTSNQPAGKSVEARKIKLEPGKRFTGWPAWNHETELRRCQKYFCRFDQVANGFITGSRTSMRLSAITPVTMRTKPALVDFEIRNVRTTSGSSITPVVTEAYIESLTQCGATIIVDSQTFNTEPYVNNTPISARIECFLDANL